MNRIPAKPQTNQDVADAIRVADTKLPQLQQLWAHDAKSLRLRMVAYLDEGFTREEAFTLATRK